MILQQIPWTRIFFLLICLNLGFLATAQSNKTMSSPSDSLYANEWTKIDSLEKQGLPQSALDEVNKLYLKASNDQQIAQLLKALIYRAKYTSQLQEDGQAVIINEFRKEVVNAPFPQNAILHSLLGIATLVCIIYEHSASPLKFS